MKSKLLLGTMLFAALSAHAQVATLNENFNGFTPGQGQSVFPQNQWTAIYPAPVGNPPPMMNIIAATATDNFVQAYSGANQNSPEYLISPQIVAPAGDKTLTFKARRNVGSAPGSVQAGLASDPSDMSTFVPLANATTLTSDTFQTITIPVPASTSQYIVFKFVGALAPHTVIEIDDVVYNQATSLSVSDQVKSKEEVRFAVSADKTTLDFTVKKDPKNIQVYSATGQKLAEGKLSGRSFDISRLQTGVYYILIETADGSAVKSKFIKK